MRRRILRKLLTGRISRRSKINSGWVFSVILIISVLIVFFHLNRDSFGGFLKEVNGNASGSEYISGGGDISVHFIDVGQGDSTLIQAFGKTLLVDAGERENGTKISDYLNKMEIEKLDYVIGTHPHSDHIGGLDYILENFDTGLIIMPEVPENLIPTTKTYEKLMETIIAKNIPVEAAIPLEAYEMGGAEFVIYAPVAEYDDLNNMSVLVKFEFEDFSVLIGGDMEKEAEEDVLSKNYDLKSTVLKLSHHGSKTSSIQEFLDAVNAEYFIIPVGKDNTYGHPDKSVLDRITAKGKPVYRTSDSGNIVFSLEEAGIKIITEK